MTRAVQPAPAPSTMSTPSLRATKTLLISFVDLSMFARDSEHREDDAIAAVLDGYYLMLDAAAAHAGGTLVKTIGDGALLVFPPERADDAARSLLQLRDEVNAAMAKAGWMSCLVVKAHLGEVVTGTFAGRFDIVGREVNVAARLQTRGFALSAEAFRGLGREARALFKKHTPPVTYLPVDDARPSRIAK